jgi:branched-chain amino acid transport system substrate-binding protein
MNALTSCRMSTRCLALLYITLATQLLTGCRNGKPAGIQIGVMLPLTGAAASIGKPCLNGIQVADDEYSARRASQEPVLSLVAEDERADPSTGISAFQKLQAVNHVKIIIGPLTSGVTLAVAPLAEKYHVVILSPGASAPAITNAGDYIFRNELSEAYGARAQADLAFSKLKYRNVALLYVNNEYGAGTVQIFRERFAELGGRVVSDQPFSPGSVDFRTTLTKIRQSHPDAIFVVFQDDIVNIVKQMAELGIATPIFTTPVFEDPANISNLGQLAENIIYTYYGVFDRDAPSGPMADFRSAYVSRFKEPPSYYSALGYDAMRILIAALRSCSFQQDAVKNSLYHIKNFPGVTGDTSFDQNGDVVKPVSLKTVRGGHFVAY